MGDDTVTEPRPAGVSVRPGLAAFTAQVRTPPGLQLQPAEEFSPGPAFGHCDFCEMGKKGRGRIRLDWPRSFLDGQNKMHGAQPHRHASLLNERICKGISATQPFRAARDPKRVDRRVGSWNAKRVVDCWWGRSHGSPPPDRLLDAQPQLSG